MPREKTKKAYHHGNLRPALIQAALQIVEKQGVEALTLREVARLAGISHAAPYRHFRDKNELLAAVAEQGFREINAEMKRALRAKSALLSFQSLGLRYVLFATQNPASFRVMYARELEDKSLYPCLLEASRETFNLMRSAIQRCQKEGSIAGFEADEIAWAAWSIVHGLAGLINDGQLKIPSSPKKIAKRVTEVLARGFLSMRFRMDPIE